MPGNACLCDMNTLQAIFAGSSAIDAVIGRHPGQEPFWGSTRRTVPNGVWRRRRRSAVGSIFWLRTSPVAADTRPAPSYKIAQGSCGDSAIASARIGSVLCSC